MTPKRIGLIGFEQVTALHLVGPADAFSAATLDNGYGDRMACYEVWTLGLRERFQAESGLSFTAQATLQTAPDFDTIIVAGGPGIRLPGVARRSPNGCWNAPRRHDASAPFAREFTVWLRRDCWMAAK